MRFSVNFKMRDQNQMMKSNNVERTDKGITEWQNR